jgi:uncharacterized membrane protein (UPF0136 family)
MSDTRERTIPSLTRNIVRLALLFGVSYGMLYFSYKYYVPRSGGNDFFQYYNMYLSPLDPSAARAPFVYRQLSAIATHLVYVSGIYYPNEIWFNDAGYDQHLFFAALLTNYIFLVLTAWVVGAIVEQEIGESAFIPATLGGLFCLLSFESQVSVITGLTEGVSWFLLALAFLFYLRREGLLLCLILALAILQRETILIIFASISGIALLLRHETWRFNGVVLFWSIACGVAYLVMRTTIFPIPGAGKQTDPAALLDNLRTFRLTTEVVFQGLLSQNLLWLYLAAVILCGDVRSRGMWLPRLLGSLLVLTAIAVAESTNVGRIDSILSPIFAALLATSCVRFERMTA